MREDALVCTHILRTEAVGTVDALKLRGGDIAPLGARVKVHAACADILPYAVHGKEQLHACSGVFVHVILFLCQILFIGLRLILFAGLFVGNSVPVVVRLLVRVGLILTVRLFLVRFGLILAVRLFFVRFGLILAVRLFLVLLHLLGLLSLVLFLPHSVDRRVDDGENADQRQQES